MKDVYERGGGERVRGRKRERKDKGRGRGKRRKRKVGNIKKGGRERKG